MKKYQKYRFSREDAKIAKDISVRLADIFFASFAASRATFLRNLCVLRAPAFPRWVVILKKGASIADVFLNMRLELGGRVKTFLVA